MSSALKKSPDGWKNVGENVVLNKEFGYISYRDGETAVCVRIGKEFRIAILNGDHRKQLEEKDLLNSLAYIRDKGMSEESTLDLQEHAKELAKLCIL